MTNGTDTGSERWLFGILMAVLALIGLVMASRAQDDMFYITGLALFAFGVLFNFSLIAKSVGRRDH